MTICRTRISRRGPPCAATSRAARPAHLAAELRRRGFLRKDRHKGGRTRRGFAPLGLAVAPGLLDWEAARHRTASGRDRFGDNLTLRPRPLLWHDGTSSRTLMLQELAAGSFGSGRATDVWTQNARAAGVGAWARSAAPVAADGSGRLAVGAFVRHRGGQCERAPARVAAVGTAPGKVTAWTSRRWLSTRCGSSTLDRTGSKSVANDLPPE